MALDVLSDGFVSLCIDPSLNAYDGKCRVLLEGQYVVNASLTTPVVPDKVIPVTGDRHIDSMFTAGSVLAESLKALLCMCPSNVEIFVIPRLDNATGAIAAVHTVTMSGTATAAVSTSITIGPYTIPIVTTVGQTAASVAAAVAAALPNPGPWTVAVAGAAITLTSLYTGTSGNLFTVGSATANGLTAATAQTTAGAGAARATYKMVIAGPAATDGAVDIFLNDRVYSVNNVIVTAGDTAAMMASAIAAEIPSRFPYYVYQSGAEILFIAKNAGTVGNHMNPVRNYRGLQNYEPVGFGMAFTRLAAGAIDPLPLASYNDVLGTCCYDCYGLLSSDRVWQRGMRDWNRASWSCDRPQCFGHAYTYNTGTLGQVLASGDNSAEFSRLAIPVNDVNFPWLMVAAYVARSCCTACDNPELNIQGPVHGRLSCVYRPQSCALPWSYDEMKQLQGAGFVTYVPGSQGTGQLTNPYIVNDVTNYLTDELQRPNATFRDAASRRLTKKTALALATKLQEFSGLSLYTKTTAIPQGVFGTNKRLALASLHSWTKSQIGILFSEFDNLEKDLTLKEDHELAAACQGIPCKLHLFMRYRPPCRVAGFSVNLQPKILEGCVAA